MQHNNDIISGKISSDIENVEWNMGTTTAQLPNVRFGSSSSQASQNSGDICRICHCESDPQNPLLTPCYCSGSLKYVHQTCLQQWLTASETNSCELCKFPFIMHTKIKPFNEWRSLDMSGVERRRLFCAILFHFAAALCVIWSLCVLIERAAEEVKRGLIGWPFWTKLVVVTVGLTGGVVFMYIQCRQYLHLCHRWRARNRILLIQNAPEKIHPPPSPVLIVRHHNLPQNNMMGSAANGNNAPSNYNNRSIAQNQCVANIENNPMNYERDWPLDDSSQSSFKPCPQGSGSMIPLSFHDSAHTMYEPEVEKIRHQQQSWYEANNQLHSVRSSINGSGLDLNQIPDSAQGMPLIASSSNTIASVAPGSGNATDYGLFKLNSMAPPRNAAAHYPTSSVFLENSDILDDKDYPKLYHRHSTIMMAPDTLHYDNDLRTRRYSDTKLLNAQNSASDEDDENGMCDDPYSNRPLPIFNVTTVLGASIPNAMTDMHADNYPVPQITDIIFNSNAAGNTYDPLELNIQEMLELDMANNRMQLRKPRYSMNNVTDANDRYVATYNDPVHNYNVGTCVNNSDNRNMFKSMPNLSASCENLLQK